MEFMGGPVGALIAFACFLTVEAGWVPLSRLLRKNDHLRLALAVTILGIVYSVVMFVPPMWWAIGGDTSTTVVGWRSQLLARLAIGAIIGVLLSFLAAKVGRGKAMDRRRAFDQVVVAGLAGASFLVVPPAALGLLLHIGYAR